MLCDKCGRENATVHLVDIRRGIPADTHLCERCAEMFLPLERGDVADELEQLPPRQENPSEFYSAAEPEPLPGETEMTSIGQHVLVADLAAGTITQVSPAAGRSFCPVWSPVSHLLAHVYLDHTRYAIRVTDPLGSQLHRFYDVGWGELPQWSPDGSHLCFSRATGDVACPVLADVRTGELSRLLYRPDRDQYQPQISPDGKSVAFLSGPPTVPPGTTPEIRLMLADLSTPPKGLAPLRPEAPRDSGVEGACPSLPTSPPRILLADREHDFGHISWSSDGRLLTVLIGPRLDTDRLDSLDLPAAQQDLLVLSVSDGATLFRLPSVAACSWSPDSARLLVVRDHQTSLSLESIDTASWSEPHPVAREIHLPGGSLAPSIWAHNGHDFVFIAGKEEHRTVWIASPSAPPRPLPVPDAIAAAWNPASPRLAVLRKSGDAHEVVLVSPDDPAHPDTAVIIDPEDYYDVVGLAWSFDGKYLALEAHSADLSDPAD